jgi:hypothetical protein
MTTYRTVVVHHAPTPLGLLPAPWAIEHRCCLCHQRVLPAQLIAHAQHHERAGSDESFQTPEASGTLAPEHGPTANMATAPGIPSASATITDQRRR